MGCRVTATWKISCGQNIRPLVRRSTRHSGSLQKNRLIALERAAAADVEYEFADGSVETLNLFTERGEGARVVGQARAAIGKARGR